MKRSEYYYIKTKNSNTRLIRVSIYHNQIQGYNMPKGYYASVTPVTIEGDMERFEAFSGYKAFLEPSERMNRNKLRTFNHQNNEMIESMVNRVCEEHHLVLD